MASFLTLIDYVMSSVLLCDIIISKMKTEAGKEQSHVSLQHTQLTTCHVCEVLPTDIS